MVNPDSSDSDEKSKASEELPKKGSTVKPPASSPPHERPTEQTSEGTSPPAELADTGHVRSGRTNPRHRPQPIEGRHVTRARAHFAARRRSPQGPREALPAQIPRPRASLHLRPCAAWVRCASPPTLVSAAVRRHRRRSPPPRRRPLVAGPAPPLAASSTPAGAAPPGRRPTPSPTASASSPSSSSAGHVRSGRTNPRRRPQPIGGRHVTRARAHFAARRRSPQGPREALPAQIPRPPRASTSARSPPGFAAPRRQRSSPPPSDAIAGAPRRLVAIRRLPDPRRPRRLLHSRRRRAPGSPPNALTDRLRVKPVLELRRAAALVSVPTEP
nr:serine/arginine repetitive matrix protein 1-like [Aegilops tauschii subsp. strangulata]